MEQAKKEKNNCGSALTSRDTEVPSHVPAQDNVHTCLLKQLCTAAQLAVRTPFLSLTLLWTERPACFLQAPSSLLFPQKAPEKVQSQDCVGPLFGTMHLMGFKWCYI